jgi:hypothetical protein
MQGEPRGSTNGVDRTLAIGSLAFAIVAYPE